jgi:hypothetical protein
MVKVPHTFVKIALIMWDTRPGVRFWRRRGRRRYPFTV